MMNPEKIWSSSNLPTLPAVAVRLLELSENPDAEIQEFTNVIKTDPAITAKILKSTNSSYFAFRNEVTSIDRAVPLLGATMVNSLALSFSLVEAAMTSGPLTQHYKSYWMKSVVQAVAAELLGEQTGVKDQYFLAGLLADLGRLAMLKTIGAEYAPVLEDAENQVLTLVDLENERLGVNHVEVGVKLMERWNLPNTLINAAKIRHADPEDLDALAAEGNPELLSVLAVAAAVSDYFCAANKGPALERMKLLTERYFKMTPDMLEDFLEQVKERMEDASATFDVNTDTLSDPVELMALANEQLAKMAMREHVASTQAREKQKMAEENNEKLKEENLHLQKQALHDPLTKIYNRNFFQDAMQREVNRCMRTASPVGVIFSDIDHFKNLNDTYGHQFGDVVLKKVAMTFQKVIRNSDVLARYGGEEFVILAVQPTEKGLLKVAERIRANVEGLEILFGDQPVPVTVSIGTALIIPRRNSENLDERLVAEADEAMYESKHGGRNRVTQRCLLDEDQRRLAQMVMQQRFSRWLVNRNVLDIPTASKLLLNCQTERVTFGTLACKHKMLDQADVDRVLEEQRATDERFGEAAIRLNLLTESQLAQLLAWQSEDPQAFASRIICDGVLGREEVEILLEQYLSQYKRAGELSEMEIASFS